MPYPERPEINQGKDYVTDISFLEEADYQQRLLLGSRFIKIALFARNFINSPFSLRNNISNLYDSVRKTRVKQYTNRGIHHSSINNPLPLFKYPNIKVWLITDELSSVNQMFLQTSSAGVRSDRLMKDMSRKNAVDFVITDLSALRDTGKFNLVKKAHEREAKIVLLVDNANVKIPTKYKRFIYKSITVGTSKSSFIQPYADIYKAIPTLPTRITSNEHGGINYVNSSEELGSLSRDKINILTRSFLESASFRDTCSVLTSIVAYYPIMVEGDRPSWLPKEIAVYKESMLAKISKPYELQRYSVKSGRTVTVNYNALSVADIVFKKLDITRDSKKHPSISIIASTRRVEEVETFIKNIEKQSIQPKEVVLMLHGIKLSKNINSIIDDSPLNIVVESISSDVIFGKVLDMALDKVTGDFTTKMDDDDRYGTNHLLDLYSAFLSSRADIVGKHNNWTYLSSEDITLNWMLDKSCNYTRHIPGGTMFAKTSTFRDLRFGYVRHGIDTDLLRRARARGAILYSTHRYNYVRVRHDDHTYIRDNQHFKKDASLKYLTGCPSSITDV